LNHRDIDHGESDHYPHPRFESRLKAAWVACKGLDEVASLHQAHALMRAGSPVKLNKTPLVAKLCQWTLDHLVRAVSSTPIHIPNTEISAKVLHFRFKDTLLRCQYRANRWDKKPRGRYCAACRNTMHSLKQLQARTSLAHTTMLGSHRPRSC